MQSEHSWVRFRPPTKTALFTVWHCYYSLRCDECEDCCESLGKRGSNRYAAAESPWQHYPYGSAITRQPFFTTAPNLVPRPAVITDDWSIPQTKLSHPQHVDVHGTTSPAGQNGNYTSSRMPPPQHQQSFGDDCRWGSDFLQDFCICTTLDFN